MKPFSTTLKKKVRPEMPNEPLLESEMSATVNVVHELDMRFQKLIHVEIFLADVRNRKGEKDAAIYVGHYCVCQIPAEAVVTVVAAYKKELMRQIRELRETMKKIEATDNDY
jgi:hypothetical protein